MKFMTLTLAACVAAFATTAIAHKGATGMLLERMNGMLAMGEATKLITPMMRGQEGYDAAHTTAYADVLRTHSGDALLALFPEGMNAAPSVAKDNIWTHWDAFEALAYELALFAEALDRAAENGMGEAAPAVTSMMGDETTSLMGGTVAAPKTLDELAVLPVNVLFAQAAQSCSACHTQFRAEE